MCNQVQGNSLLAQKKALFEFNDASYQLQKKSYDEECNPKLIPRGKFICVRVTFPIGIWKKTNPRIIRATWMTTEEGASLIAKGDAASPKDIAIQRLYNEFDEKLGVTREFIDPFTNLINQGRRRFNNTQDATPKYERYTSVIDWALDDNFNDATTSSEIAAEYNSYKKYLDKLTEEPDYKPVITTELNQDLKFQQHLYNEEVFRTEGVRNLDALNSDIYSDAVGGGYEEATGIALEYNMDDDSSKYLNYWDYIRWNFHELYREATGDRNDNINGFHWSFVDIYEANQKKMGGKEFVKAFGRTSAITDYFFAFDGDETAMTELFKLLDQNADTNYDGRYKRDRPEGEWLEDLIRRYKDMAREESRRNPLPHNMQDPLEVEATTTKNLVQGKLKRKVVVPPPNTHNVPTILQLLPEYMLSDKWRDKTSKGKNAEEGLVRRADNILTHIHGYPKPINQILPNDATLIAQTLEEGVTEHTWLKDLGVQGGRSESGIISNNTIKEYVGSIRLFFDWACKKTKDDAVTIKDVWVERNPFIGVSLDNYGEEERTYEALTEHQLYALFDLKMSDRDLLIFKLLLTTGARLDEVCLLTWESYKLDSNNLRYFDLSMVQTKNDKYSNRNVAIPDIIELEHSPYDMSPQPVLTGNEGKGRLFDFPKDTDGKSSKWASKELNKAYLFPIRFSKEKYNKPRIVNRKQTGELLPDNKKVVHSLRNNLTGLMAQLKPYPSSEVMNWITGHGMKDKETASVRVSKYLDIMDVGSMYEIVNRIKHPWLDETERNKYLEEYPFVYEGWINDAAQE